MGALLDTSVLIDLERRSSATGSPFGHSFANLLRGALDPNEPVAIATITASELLHGVHRATPQHRPRREAFVEAILAAVPTVPFDLRAARTYARIWAELAASGVDFGPHDRIIASSALSLGWKVVTANARHFNAIAGLDVLEQRAEA